MRFVPRRTLLRRRSRAIFVTRFPSRPATPDLPRDCNICALSCATNPQAASAGLRGCFLQHPRWRGPNVLCPNGLSCTCFPAPTLTPAGRNALTPVKRDAQVRPLNAQWTDTGGRNAPSPPFNRRRPRPQSHILLPRTPPKAAQAYFDWDVHGQLVPNQTHWKCKLHGAGSSAFSRKQWVRGSGGGKSRPPDGPRP